MKRRISRCASPIVPAFSGLTFWSANAAADSTQQLVGDIECAHSMRMVVEAKVLGGYVLDSIALLIVEGRT